MADPSAVASVCIECGECNSRSVFKVYSAGSIQLSQCEHCHSFIDKYWEYDGVLLMLDVFLLRVQAFRHLLFNYKLSISFLWRLSVTLVLCCAYVNTHLACDRSTVNNFVLTQLNFHLSLVQSVIEFVLRVLLSCLSISILESSFKLSWLLVIKLVIVTQFSVFFAVVSFIWVDEFFVKFILFLTVPAQIKAYQAISPNIGAFRLLTVIASQALLLYTITLSLTSIKLRTFKYFHKQMI